MAHGQSMTRRALLKGAAVAIVGANVAGTAAAPLFSDQEVLQMRAERVIYQWTANGAQLIPQPDGSLFSFVYVDEPQTEAEEAAIEKLREELMADPALKTEVRRLLRQYYGMQA